MQTIKKEIKRNILLNPGPATTTARVKSALIEADICPRESEFGDVLARVKEKCLRVVDGNKSHQAILIGGSGTAAIEACLSRATDDKKILILENGAYGERMAKICSALKIPHHTIKFAWGDPISQEIVQKHLLEHAHEYSTMAFIHHETTVGILNDLPNLYQLASRHKLSTLVDAMSSYAGIEINLQHTPVDYLVSSSNKCIQGFAGLGICLVKNETLTAIRKHPQRSFYLDLIINFDAQEKTHQFAFTPPVQILYALDEALNEFFEQGGIKARAKRYADLYTVMVKGLEELGFKSLVAPKDHAKLLTAFRMPEISGFSFKGYHDYLYAKGITIYPGKNAKENSFRVANIGDLTLKDIELFLKETSNYLKTL
ncbi:MAG: 2-aminoethylphosphonate--pyruvate transaminase [Bacteriovoracaceae bacterium]